MAGHAFKAPITCKTMKKKSCECIWAAVPPRGDERIKVLFVWASSARLLFLRCFQNDLYLLYDLDQVLYNGAGRGDTT